MRCSVCALQQIEEDAKQHSIKATTASIAQLVVQLAYIQKVTGWNSGGEQIFLNINTLANMFFRIQF